MVILILVITHGMIHLLGFTKAFNLANVSQLTQHITKANGFLWLIAASLFIVTAMMFILKNELWWIPSLAAIILSQFLISGSWHDAKFGTIANVIILLFTIVGYATWHFSSKYKREVKTALKSSTSGTESLLTETDIQDLPVAVKKYLHYTGAVGRPKIKNFRIESSGQLRKNEQSPWMPFTSMQYNFLDPSIRMFFLNATMKHLPVAGFHSFKNGNAFMDIRLLSLIKVQYQSGREMGISETVTSFNDMCCMAPATLIDKRIKWLESEGNKVKAEFTSNNITISAWLYFNDNGELVDFISDDRYATDNKVMRRLRWATPLKDYKEFNGHRISSYAEAIYSYPEGDVSYGNFQG